MIFLLMNQDITNLKQVVFKNNVKVIDNNRNIIIQSNQIVMRKIKTDSF